MRLNKNNMFVLYFILLNATPLLCRHRKRYRDLPDVVRDKYDILGIPKHISHLPRGEKVLPGHTLLQPAFGMLRSSIKYPLSEKPGLVYGNADNLGITHGKTRERVLYSGFRKSNERDLLNNAVLALAKSVNEQILDLTRQRKEKKKHQRKSQLQHSFREHLNDKSSSFGTFNQPSYPLLSRKRPLLIVVLKPRSEDGPKQIQYYVSPTVTEDNSAQEILDNYDSKPNSFRRKLLLNSEEEEYYKGLKKHFSSFYKMKEKLEPFLEELYSKEDESDSPEINPGNPYTIHKNKYIKNWLWNFELDGDHKNINPFAPMANPMRGPQGKALIFNRKWWYYNQDDYLPLR